MNMMMMMNFICYVFGYMFRRLVAIIWPLKDNLSHFKLEGVISGKEFMVFLNSFWNLLVGSFDSVWKQLLSRKFRILESYAVLSIIMIELPLSAFMMIALLWRNFSRVPLSILYSL
jgi:hypothetical protein